MDATTERAPSKPWFTRTIAGFGVASFLSDMGHEAATSALPALLASFGAPPAALGIIEGISDGLSSFAKLLGGWLSDVPARRKPIAVIGYLVTGLAKGAYAFTTVWPEVLVARSIGWIARGIRGPARDAMLADAVPPEARGRAFGFHRAMDTAGAAVGPLLATILIAAHMTLHQLFLWTVVPGVLSAAAFAILVKTDGTVAREKPLAFWHSLRSLPVPYRGFLNAVFLFGIGDFARTLLILRATQLLKPELGAVEATATAMGLYVLHNVLYALGAYPVGWIADRLSPYTLLIVGYCLGIVTAVLAAMSPPSVAVLVVLFVVAGLALSFTDTLEGTIVATEVPSPLRGTGYGALATVNGVGDLVSSSMVGILWSFFGAKVAFMVAAFFCVVAVIQLAIHSGMRRATA